MSMTITISQMWEATHPNDSGQTPSAHRVLVRCFYFYQMDTQHHEIANLLARARSSAISNIASIITIIQHTSCTSLHIIVVHYASFIVNHSPLLSLSSSSSSSSSSGMRTTQKKGTKTVLVGGFNPSEKCESKWSHIGVKIKHVWNHLELCGG